MWSTLPPPFTSSSPLKRLALPRSRYQEPEGFTVFDQGTSLHELEVFLMHVIV